MISGRKHDVAATEYDGRTVGKLARPCKHVKVAPN
jgi:hypothetical protein